MTNRSQHQGLILTGCLLWIASFLGEKGGLQPYSTFGLVISPILIIVGVFRWARYYRDKRGYYPQPGRIISSLMKGMAQNPFFGIGFLVRHLLHFWTLCILFWTGILFLLFCVFSNSAAFTATKKYCETNADILAKTGEIKYYSPLISGSIHQHNGQGNAELFFTIVGTKGNIKAASSVTQQNGDWTVKELKLHP
jgi:hypothetical protein